MTPEQKAVAIADKIVPAYRAKGSRYSCTGNIAKMWQAAYDGALAVLKGAVESDAIEALAAKLAASDGLNWDEVCPYEVEDGDPDGCDSSTCVAAHYEDHDPAIARGQYMKWAKVALTAAPAQPGGGEAITFRYTNWRGEVADRTAIPRGLRWGATEWHPEPGWLLLAFDTEKQADREFALKDCLFATPAPSERGEVERLREKVRADIINTPETVDFMAGVPLEAAHQRDRWGADHDAGKSPFDWFWLIGYLAQKAADASVRGDVEKALHHTISTAAALANWHAALAGDDTRMRPGISAEIQAAAEGRGALSQALAAASLATIATSPSAEG